MPVVTFICDWLVVLPLRTGYLVRWIVVLRIVDPLLFCHPWLRCGLGLWQLCLFCYSPSQRWPSWILVSCSVVVPVYIVHLLPGCYLPCAWITFGFGFTLPCTDYVTFPVCVALWIWFDVIVFDSSFALYICGPIAVVILVDCSLYGPLRYLYVCWLTFPRSIPDWHLLQPFRLLQLDLQLLLYRLLIVIVLWRWLFVGLYVVYCGLWFVVPLLFVYRSHCTHTYITVMTIYVDGCYGCYCSSFVGCCSYCSLLPVVDVLQRAVHLHALTLTFPVVAIALIATFAFVTVTRFWHSCIAASSCHLIPTDYICCVVIAVCCTDCCLRGYYCRLFSGYCGLIGLRFFTRLYLPFTLRLYVGYWFAVYIVFGLTFTRLGPVRYCPSSPRWFITLDYSLIVPSYYVVHNGLRFPVVLDLFVDSWPDCDPVVDCSCGSWTLRLYCCTVVFTIAGLGCCHCTLLFVLRWLLHLPLLYL